MNLELVDTYYGQLSPYFISPRILRGREWRSPVDYIYGNLLANEAQISPSLDPVEIVATWAPRVAAVRVGQDGDYAALWLYLDDLTRRNMLFTAQNLIATDFFESTIYPTWATRAATATVPREAVNAMAEAGPMAAVRQFLSQYDVAREREQYIIDFVVRQITPQAYLTRALADARNLPMAMLHRIFAAFAAGRLPAGLYETLNKRLIPRQTESHRGLIEQWVANLDIDVIIQTTRTLPFSLNTPDETLNSEWITALENRRRRIAPLDDQQLRHVTSGTMDQYFKARNDTVARMHAIIVGCLAPCNPQPHWCHIIYEWLAGAGAPVVAATPDALIHAANATEAYSVDSIWVPFLRAQTMMIKTSLIGNASDQFERALYRAQGHLRSLCCDKLMIPTAQVPDEFLFKLAAQLLVLRQINSLEDLTPDDADYPVGETEADQWKIVLFPLRFIGIVRFFLIYECFAN